MSVPSSYYSSLSTDPGIYLFYDNKGELLYVGKAKNLKNRVSSYFQRSAALGERTRQLVSQVAKVKTIVTDSEIESLLLEANFIKKHLPKYNIKLTDDKAYPIIRVTAKEMFPAVLVARRLEMQPQDGSAYFGPFPNAGDMRMVLRTIRRIFPYQSVLNHAKRYCLYYHLGLCPCPPMLSTQGLRDYKITIRRIIRVLSGESKAVLKELEKERGNASKIEDFEKAIELQRQINAMTLITQPIHPPFDYEVNPNLRSDLRDREMADLQAHLQTSGVSVNKLVRIECYDISNTSGTNATGSLVVFTNGEKDGNWYRRFKIRKTKGPNDFAMMKEVFERRLAHSEWPMPDLFVVDGGKGQISSAQEVLNEKGVNVPLVGLAKREETIITSDFKEIKLPKSSPALQLVMRMRDEAHRFAITYHKKLRSRSFISA